MRLYRVFPYDSRAAPTDPGGPLYLPPGAGGRVDNPDAYGVLYASNYEEGAVAEKFGRIPLWDPQMLIHPNGLPYALASYDLDTGSRLFDLDNAEHLQLLSLKPSDVVRRDLKRSQSWAREIYRFGNWDGISWWSFYGPQWQSIAVWNAELISLAAPPVVLRISDDAVLETASSIVRLISKA